MKVLSQLTILLYEFIFFNSVPLWWSLLDDALTQHSREIYDNAIQAPEWVHSRELSKLDWIAKINIYWFGQQSEALKLQENEEKKKLQRMEKSIRKV